MLLGFQAEFKDHGRYRDSRTGTLGSVGSQPDSSKGRFRGGLVVRKCGRCWAGKS
jgi:hypothetical protein